MGPGAPRRFSCAEAERRANHVAGFVEGREADRLPKIQTVAVALDRRVAEVAAKAGAPVLARQADETRAASAARSACPSRRINSQGSDATRAGAMSGRGAGAGHMLATSATNGAVRCIGSGCIAASLLSLGGVRRAPPAPRRRHLLSCHVPETGTNSRRIRPEAWRSADEGSPKPVCASVAAPLHPSSILSRLRCSHIRARTF